MIGDKRKIFITGASSNLMQNLISLIDTNKYLISGLTRIRTKISNQNVHTIVGDILDNLLIKTVVVDSDIIIHAAAQTHSGNKNTYFEVNFEATKRLVDAAKFHKVKKFIYISSRTAGMNSGDYGVSKYLAEQYIKENLNNWIIFRPSEIFGINKNEGIENLINEVLKKRVLLCPVNIPSKLFPIHVQDTALIMFDFIFNKEAYNKIIFINGKEGFSYKEFIQNISNISGRRNIIIPIPKFIMFVIKHILELFNLDIGIKPDQIDRLYSVKESENLDYNFIQLNKYVLEKIESDAKIY